MLGDARGLIERRKGMGEWMGLDRWERSKGHEHSQADSVRLNAFV